MQQIMSYCSNLQRSVGHLDREHWIVISVVILAVGIFFLKGFGSRTSY